MRNVKDNHAVQFGTIQTFQIKVAAQAYSIQTIGDGLIHYRFLVDLLSISPKLVILLSNFVCTRDRQRSHLK